MGIVLVYLNKLKHYPYLVWKNATTMYAFYNKSKFFYAF